MFEVQIELMAVLGSCVLVEAVEVKQYNGGRGDHELFGGSYNSQNCLHFISRLADGVTLPSCYSQPPTNVAVIVSLLSRCVAI